VLPAAPDQRDERFWCRFFIFVYNFWSDMLREKTITKEKTLVILSKEKIIREVALQREINPQNENNINRNK